MIRYHTSGVTSFACTSQAAPFATREGITPRHRPVNLGARPSRAVLTLYLLGAIGGGAAVLVSYLYQRREPLFVGALTLALSSLCHVPGARPYESKPPSHRLLRHKTNRLDDTPAAVSKALEVCPPWWIRYTYRAFLSLTLRAGQGPDGMQLSFYRDIHS